MRASPARVYEVCGLRVRSDVPLSLGRSSSEPADVEIRSGPSSPVPDEAPGGRVVAQMTLDGCSRYTGVDGGHTFTLRVHGICDFVISRDLRAVECRLDPGADPEYLPILLRGTVAAFLLGLAGRGVLHASAVDAGGSAIAIVGHSGSGKSTLAALLCSSGARLVSDDVLPVEVGAAALCRRSSDELRLRPAAASLVRGFGDGVTRRVTADGRLAIRPPGTVHGCLPLQALVIPLPSRTVGSLAVRRLSPAEAVFALARFPRIVGWRPHHLLRAQFDLLTRLAVIVPVWSAVVPWGPPFAPGLADELLECIAAAPPNAGDAPFREVVC